MDTGRGSESTRLEPHPHTMTGHSIRGTLKLEGKIGTCHVWAQVFTMWAFVAESLRLEITGIWCQVVEIRGWCAIFYPKINIDVPLSVDWDKGQR